MDPRIRIQHGSSNIRGSGSGSKTDIYSSNCSKKSKKREYQASFCLYSDLRSIFSLGYFLKMEGQKKVPFLSILRVFLVIFGSATDLTDPGGDGSGSGSMHTSILNSKFILQFVGGLKRREVMPCIPHQKGTFVIFHLFR